MAIRYAQLKEIGVDREFKGIQSLSAIILKQPATLFSAILIQRCTEMKWDSLDECELCFEVREDDDVLASEMKTKCNYLIK